MVCDEREVFAAQEEEACLLQAPGNGERFSLEGAVVPLGCCEMSAATEHKFPPARAAQRRLLGDPLAVLLQGNEANTLVAVVSEDCLGVRYVIEAQSLGCQSPNSVFCRGDECLQLLVPVHCLPTWLLE